MENILSGTKVDTRWKYLTGEWFYEAKSRRHMDKIHGSEIILASMKQKKSPLGVFILSCWQALSRTICLCNMSDVSCHTCLTFYFSSPAYPAVDGSLRIERSKTNSSRGSGVVAPKKPARCPEALQPREIKYTVFIKDSIKAVFDVLIQPVDSKRRKVTVSSGQRRWWRRCWHSNQSRSSWKPDLSVTF